MTSSARAAAEAAAAGGVDVGRAVPTPVQLDEASCAALVPERGGRAHKGTHGTLVCVCGSLDYAGAALLCGLAAARVGTGLVALAVPAELQPVLAGRVPELVTLGLPGGDVAAAVAAIQARRPSALVVGPGLNEGEPERALVTALVARPDPAMVLDGGALNLLAGSGEWSAGVRSAIVLTPHPGEFGRLTGRPVGGDDDERAARCAEAAEQFGCVVVLKGAHTVVAAPDGRIARAPFENPALATAGTGDVLAGAIGGLLAQRLEPFAAACLGVFLHGSAAERVRDRLGDAGLLASDLPLEMALVRRQLDARRSGRGSPVGFGRRAIAADEG